MKYNLLVFLAVIPALSFIPERIDRLTEAEFYGQLTGHPEVISIIADVNEHYGYPLEVLIAICQHESKFNPKAVNYNKNGTVDKGLFQTNSRYFNSPCIFDARTNISLGVSYFDELMRRHHTIRSAIQHYNPRAAGYADKIILDAMNLKEKWLIYDNSH
jgi:soluble lytic murein transglycosylase-like protein